MKNILFKYKWCSIIVFFAFIGSAADAAKFITFSYGVSPTFFEIVLAQTNSVNVLLFRLSLLLLFFTLDDIPDFHHKIIITILVTLKKIVISTFVYMLFFLSANIIFCLINFDLNYVFLNEWSYIGEFLNSGLGPISAFGYSILFISLRFIFSLFLAYILDFIVFKRYIGMWIILIISIIDFNFYTYLNIYYPLKILPIEHSKVTYTIACVPNIYNYARFPYVISVIYWLVLISILSIIYFLILKSYVKRKKQYEKKL